MNTKIIGQGTLALTALTLAFLGAGLNVNLSASAPAGIWKERPLGETIERGSLVGVCPPETPVVRAMVEVGQLAQWNCIKTGLAPLLKAVGAISGDLVTIRKGYPVLVNGNALPNTVSSPKIPSWLDGEYRVNPGEVWIFSTYNNKSFDSRYFGPVPVSNIQVLAEPILIAGNADNMKLGIPHD